MRFLIDNALSPDVARDLRALGHDAIHVRDVGRARQADHRIFDFAAAERRIVTSADTDFSGLLALRGTLEPSVVQLRDGTDRVPAKQAPLIHHWASVHEEALLAGAVLTIEHGRCRVRRVPIVPPPKRRRRD